MTRAALAISTAILALIALTIILTRGTGMECTTYPDEATFEAQHEGGAPPAYRPAAPVGTIVFTLRGLPSGPDAILRVDSHHLSQPVWLGPAQDEIRIPFGQELMIDNGWDELRFTLIDPSARRICGAVNEAGARVWLADAHLIVSFLERPIRDDNGLLTMYRITAR